jgi:hypothetical protein
MIKLAAVMVVGLLAMACSGGDSKAATETPEEWTTHLCGLAASLDTAVRSAASNTPDGPLAQRITQQRTNYEAYVFAYDAFDKGLKATAPPSDVSAFRSRVVGFYRNERDGYEKAVQMLKSARTDEDLRAAEEPIKDALRRSFNSTKDGGGIPKGAVQETIDTLTSGNKCDRLRIKLVGPTS